MFTQLSFRNFRGFDKLDLHDLKRVNLVVGRNNSGKTSLLEGIAITADPNRIPNMPDLLRPSVGNNSQRYFRWLMRDHAQASQATLEASRPTGQVAVVLRRPSSSEASLPAGYENVYQNDSIGASIPKGRPTIRFGALSAQQRAQESLVRLFARAVKQKGGEERVESLLRAVDDRVRKVRVELSEDSSAHVMIDFGLSEMLPLSQAGQGMYRLVAILSELIAEHHELCLIDEIENSIHHSLLEQVWTGIAAAAEELDVQVFAATHGHECVQAAHSAFLKGPRYDFSVVQLFRVADGKQGRVLNQEHIQAALAGEIDLR